MPVMMRFQVPSRAQSLNHKPIPQVNSLASKLIDGKGIPSFLRMGGGTYCRMISYVLLNRVLSDLQQFSFSVSRRFLDGVMERRLG
jgi:hypothetical protein